MYDHTIDSTFDYIGLIASKNIEELKEFIKNDIDTVNVNEIITINEAQASLAWHLASLGLLPFLPIKMIEKINLDVGFFDERLIDIYRRACEYIRMVQWPSLYELVVDHGWLLLVRDLEKNTLLHQVTLRLNSFSQSNLSLFLDNNEELLTLLKCVASLKNTNGDTADMLANTTRIRNAVRKEVSSFQEHLEAVLLDHSEKYRFITEIMCHEYAFPKKRSIKINKVEDGKATVCKLNTMDEIVYYFNEQLSTSISFCDYGYLNATAQSQLGAIFDKAQKAKNLSETINLGCWKLLTKEEVFSLEKLYHQLEVVNRHFLPSIALPIENTEHKRKRDEEENNNRPQKIMKDNNQVFFSSNTQISNDNDDNSLNTQISDNNDDNSLRTSGL